MLLPATSSCAVKLAKKELLTLLAHVSEFDRSVRFIGDLGGEHESAERHGSGIERWAPIRGNVDETSDLIRAHVGPPAGTRRLAASTRVTLVTAGNGLLPLFLGASPRGTSWFVSHDFLATTCNRDHVGSLEPTDNASVDAG